MLATDLLGVAAGVVVVVVCGGWLLRGCCVGREGRIPETVSLSDGEWIERYWT